MSKLSNLKKWLTVPDAAKQLTISFGEDVSEADVLRLALDGHLQLSVHLVNGAYARRCNPIQPGDVKFNRVTTLDGSGVIDLPIGGPVWSNELGVFQVTREIIELDAAVWDLPLVKGERLDVEHKYQMLTGGPEVTLVNIDGALVRSLAGSIFELQEHFSDNKHFNKENLESPYYHPDNFYPAGGLPPDSVLVVRIEALREFEAAISEPSTVAETASPAKAIRDNSLLATIAALLATWPGGKKPTAKDLERAAQAIGVNVSDCTIGAAMKAARAIAPGLPD